MNIHIPPLRRGLALVPGEALARVTSMRRDLKVIRAAAIVIMVVALLAVSSAAADLLAPTAIAIVLALVLAPVARGIERLRIPAGIASVFAVLVTAGGLAGGAIALAPAATEWFDRAPQIVHSVERKLRPIKRQIAAVETASKQITQVAVTAAVAPAPAMVTDGILVTAMNTAPWFLAKCVYVTMLTIFLLAWRQRYAELLILLPVKFENRLRMARICRDVKSGVSGYLFTLSLINAGLAVITALCFWAAGIADPVLWGIAFGLLNFIPILGPTTVIGAAAIVGFATGNTIADALVPPAILLAINVVEANLVQPWLLSRRIVISPVVIFIMVVALVWMWGAAAAITAVPLLILFHTIAQNVPSLRPVAVLLATEDLRKNGK